ncbi:uncharacterized protein LOC143234950 [Tachypleus tridentatus]|uniref:uncharacterized protein LOC143234950 n=1 Tax=Tachypleus tridentatus TaxID=6853 RepID=UPI003FD3BC07
MSSQTGYTLHPDESIKGGGQRETIVYKKGWKKYMTNQVLSHNSSDELEEVTLNVIQEQGNGSTGENGQVPSRKAEVKANMNTNSNDPNQGLAIKLPGLGSKNPMPKFLLWGEMGVPRENPLSQDRRRKFCLSCARYLKKRIHIINKVIACVLVGFKTTLHLLLHVETLFSDSCT